MTGSPALQCPPVAVDHVEIRCNTSAGVAADEAELKHMIATAAAHDTGPIAFRYPRGEGVGVDLPDRGTVLKIGKGRLIQQGKRVALLSLGTRLEEVRKAAEALGAIGDPDCRDAVGKLAEAYPEVATRKALLRVVAGME